MAHAYFFSLFWGVFRLVYLLFHGPAQYRKNMGAILQPLSAQILLDISVEPRPFRIAIPSNQAHLHKHDSPAQKKGLDNGGTKFGGGNLITGRERTRVIFYRF